MLPATMQRTRKAQEKLAAEQAELAAKQVAETREWERLASLVCGEKINTQKLATLESFYQMSKADVESFPTSLDATDISTTRGWGEALARANSACVAEKLLKILPRKIAQLRAEMDSAAVEIATLRAKYE